MQKAVQDGKVALGVREVLKNLKESKGRFVVVSKSCPELETITYYAGLAKIPLHEFEGDGYDLGATVKKPFSVSAVLVSK